jgi:nitroreductase
MRKPAEANHEIHELLQTRWSPRAFSNRPIEAAKLLSLFEAARWSPSGGNGQPWAFIVATQDYTETHQKLVDIMKGRNPDWAKHVPVLVLAVAKLNAERPAMNRFAYYDLGQAVAHLSVQANALGLHVHQMAGFDHEKARQLFEIPDGNEPMTLIAIGYYGSLEDLPDDLREREIAPRTRKPLSEFVFKGQWNQPLEAPEAEQSAGQ